jgi:hypothetical protein
MVWWRIRQDDHEWHVGEYGSGMGLFQSTVLLLDSKDLGRNNFDCSSEQFIIWPGFEQNTSRTLICNLMCSMSVHYIIQKTLNTNKCTKSFFINYNTLLHVSTLLGQPQGETFRCRYTRLHYTVERECAVECALRRLWRRELFVVSADPAGSKHVVVCYNWRKKSLCICWCLMFFD